LVKSRVKPRAHDVVVTRVPEELDAETPHSEAPRTRTRPTEESRIRDAAPEEQIVGAIIVGIAQRDDDATEA
jgi:hypothetical protein